jgi:hypothetical protein
MYNDLLILTPEEWLLFHVFCVIRSGQGMAEISHDEVTQTMHIAADAIKKRWPDEAATIHAALLTILVKWQDLPREACRIANEQGRHFGARMRDDGQVALGYGPDYGWPPLRITPT